MTRQSTRRPRTVLLAVAAGAFALAAAGCSVGTTAGGSPQATPTPSASGALGKAPGGGPGTAPTASPGPTGSPAPGGGAGNQGQPGGGHGGPTTPAAPRPHIVHFAVKQRPKCPQGTSAYPVPAVPLIIAWKVTGTHQVQLSVDGPGVYKTYGRTGQETFTFSCGGAAGTVETHSYSITTVGGGPARTRTLTVSATVNEIPQV